MRTRPFEKVQVIQQSIPPIHLYIIFNMPFIWHDCIEIQYILRHMLGLEKYNISRMLQCSDN